MLPRTLPTTHLLLCCCCCGEERGTGACHGSHSRPPFNDTPEPCTRMRSPFGGASGFHAAARIASYSAAPGRRQTLNVSGRAAERTRKAKSDSLVVGATGCEHDDSDDDDDGTRGGRRGGEAAADASEGDGRGRRASRRWASKRAQSTLRKWDDERAFGLSGAQSPRRQWRTHGNTRSSAAVPRAAPQNEKNHRDAAHLAIERDDGVAELDPGRRRGAPGLRHETQRYMAR